MLTGRLVQEAAAIFFFSFLILGTQAAKQLCIWFDWAFLWDFKGSKPLQYSGPREKKMHSTDVLELIQPQNSVAAWHQERPWPGARTRISAGHWNEPLVFTYLPLRAAWLQAFMSVLGMRPVPVGLVAPLKIPPQAQHLASNIDFLEVPCLCLSTGYARCGHCGEVCCSSCSCSDPVTAVSPLEMPISFQGKLPVLFCSVPQCAQVCLWESFFLGHRKPVWLQGS